MPSTGPDPAAPASGGGCAARVPRRRAAVTTGLDQVARSGLPLPGRGRVAVLCNASTVSSRWTPTLDALIALPGVHIERIFSPQHGFGLEKQDNMIESPDGVHPRHGLPIISLYAERREPQPAHFDGIDALIVDVPDVGTRVYTFLATALLAIRAAARAGVPTVILDRPNPIAGAIEGPIAADAFLSFVGLIDVPLRHGLTAGELCMYGAVRLDVAGGKDTLSVVKANGWTRDRYHDETGLPWTPPSPNMPSLDTACVYPGQVVLEGTNLSEGRGTTRPFELFGAPWLVPQRVLAELEPERGLLAGALLREVTFEPTFHKYAGQLVRGFQLHVLDRRAFRPVATTVTLLAAIRRAHGSDLAWKAPPYEYERDRLPVDLIFGTDRVRLALEDGRSPREIVMSWTRPLAEYRERIAPFLLYDPPPEVPA